jgi:hypothetical protein
MLVDFLAKRGKSAALTGPGSSAKLGAAATTARNAAGTTARRVAPTPGQRVGGGSSIGRGSDSSIAAGETITDRDRDTSKIGGKSGPKKLLVAKTLDDQNPADSLGEFVFDLGPKRSANTGVKDKSASAISSKIAAKRKKKENQGPIWIWILVGVGALTIIGLLIAMLNS